MKSTVSSAIFLASQRIHILVNNAGIAGIGRVDTTAPADFDRVFQLNVKAFSSARVPALDRWWRAAAESFSIWRRSLDRADSRTDFPIR